MNEETDSVRCFLGVPLNSESNGMLDELVQTLKVSAAARDVRWVDAANRHLTLAFLGNQPLDTVFPLQAALQSLILKHNAFELVGSSVCGFPDAKSAIVALQLEPVPELMTLVVDIQAILRTQQLPIERRTYRPHITLGRLRRGQSWQQPAQSCSVRFPVQSVVLYQSCLTAAGAQYTPLWSLPLSA